MKEIEKNKPLEECKNGFKNMPSAFDRLRATESFKLFGKKAQKDFGSNERGSEDVIDMMEKGTL